MQRVPPAGTIAIIRRERWRIERVSVQGPCARVDAARASATPPGETRRSFIAPFDRIDPARIADRRRVLRRQQWRARAAHALAVAERVGLPLAALDARIDLLAWQLEPALAVLAGARRILIADAVGLGKTIQAGLIAAELMRREGAAAILIAAPANLCTQWRAELDARFNIDVRIADAATLAELVSDLPRYMNPWTQAGVLIASLDFLKQPHVFDGLPARPWDLVVIDEAHMVTTDSNRRTAADAMTAHARRALLLSATPLSGATDDAEALLSLGRLGPDDEAMVVFRRSHADAGISRTRVVRSLRVALTDDERAALDGLAEFSRAVASAATRDTEEGSRLLVSVLTKRALSTFGALARSIDRRLAHLAGQDQPEMTQTAFDFGDGIDAALFGRTGLGVDRERAWLRRLATISRRAARVESKISRLAALIARTREAAIVFTEFRDSLELAARMLERVASIAVVHGGQRADELDASLARFASGDARVLVATDVASQGVNLQQRARWIIHLDLPWNPIRLEQRAGRVDRLGQSRDVHVTELTVNHASDAAFAARLSARAEAAAASDALTSRRDWERRARAAVRVLQKRRALKKLWRGPAITSTVLRARGQSVVLIELPITNEAGTVLEQKHGLVQESKGPNVQGAAARTRRVKRIVEVRDRRIAETERRLGEAQRAAGSRERQPMIPGLPGTRTDAS